MIPVLKTSIELEAMLALPRERGGKIGFVPTMGALHEGHATLIRASAEECSVTVVSVFVNPTQFGPNEDFARYPRTLEADCALAEASGATHVFAPGVEEMYPAGFTTTIDAGAVAELLCGAFRPGHFRGVATVVHRLFQLVRPSVAYFGQKDLQQCLVIQRMVTDLSVPVAIVTVPTVRESDGLAMSSRNRYLSPEDRQRALVIHRSLQAVKREFAKGVTSTALLEAAGRKVLDEVPEFKIQYAEVRSFPDLERPSEVLPKSAYLVAGYLGATRLIDNILL